MEWPAKSAANSLSTGSTGPFGDVLHGGFQESAFGKQPEGGAEKALADFRAVTFAAAGLRDDRVAPSRYGRCHGKAPDLTDTLTRL